MDGKKIAQSATFIYCQLFVSSSYCINLCTFQHTSE